MMRKKKAVTKRASGLVRPIATEEQEQRALASMLDAAGIRWFHPANGGLRHIRTAVKLRAAGVKAGVPDVIITTRVPKYPEFRGLAIELKRERGGVVSSEQQQWIDGLIEDGWKAMVCFGAEQARAMLRELGYRI